jgi:hypothetical protein
VRWPGRSPSTAAPRRAHPQRVPLGPPGGSGEGWPDPALLGRPSFAARTHLETGTRRAYDPEAHEAAERLVDAALPRLRLAVAGEDAPHLRKVFVSAARVGVGLGLVECGTGVPVAGEVDRDVAAALWLARGGLPPMPADRAAAAAWFLLAGHALGRCAAPERDALAADLLDALVLP